jgi:hypothetical protein
VAPKNFRGRFKRFLPDVVPKANGPIARQLSRKRERSNEDAFAIAIPASLRKTDLPSHFFLALPALNIGSPGELA